MDVNAQESDLLSAAAERSRPPGGDAAALAARKSSLHLRKSNLRFEKLQQEDVSAPQAIVIGRQQGDCFLADLDVPRLSKIVVNRNSVLSVTHCSANALDGSRLPSG